jgi:hypothetical protein
VAASWVTRKRAPGPAGDLRGYRAGLGVVGLGQVGRGGGGCHGGGQDVECVVGELAFLPPRFVVDGDAFGVQSGGDLIGQRIPGRRRGAAEGVVGPVCTVGLVGVGVVGAAGRAHSDDQSHLTAVGWGDGGEDFVEQLGAGSWPRPPRR